MQKAFYIICAAMAIGLARTADAVDWQFTGATNRAAVATQSGMIAGEFNSVLSRACTIAVSGEFDSRYPSIVRSDGYNMRSDAAGALIIFR